MSHHPQGRHRRLLALFASVALILGLAPVSLASADDPVNLGLNRPVEASGREVPDRFGPELAFDGDIGPDDPTPGPVHNAADASRWSADVNDNAWIQVDFGNTATVDQVKIRWGNTYATTYDLLGSADGSTWDALETDLPGPTARGTWTTVDLTAATGVRHLKLQIDGKSQEWALSIWEIEAMGTLDAPPVEPAFVDVIPKPAHAVGTDAGAFQLSDTTSIVATGDALGTADLLAETLRASTGFALPVAASGDDAITLNLDDAADIAAEGYELVSGADGVTITASDRAGLFYGTQTLVQLLGPWARSADVVVQDWSVTALDIEDAPRYGYRGLMLDPARSFIEVDEVMRVMDQMAAHKMNVLHMHLSDDQGWRIAISNENKAEGDDIDYSLLTTKSGATAVTIADGTDLPGRTGFYTADDFASIIAHADARNIAIVPEIDGPAHSNAILHAIPQLNSENSFPKPAAGETTAAANTTITVGDSSLDARNEETFVFMKHVIDDLVRQNTTAVHGTDYVHIGGDESEKNTTKEDYRTYMGRVSADVKAAGAVPIVWNEGAATATDELPSDTVVQYWTAFQGLPETQNFLANHAESKVLVSHASHTYLPQRPGTDVYGPSWACSSGACGINEFYNWDPTAKAGVDEAKVLGVETPHWSERTRSESSLEFQLYARVMATAEVGWTPQAERNIQDFRNRMTSLGTSLTVQGRNFYPSDGTWETNVAALQTSGLKSDTNIGDIAVGSMPLTPVGDVSANVTFDGVEHDVDVSVAWEHMLNMTSYDNRQANGLFTFTLTEKLAGGTHTGDLVVTAGGDTVTVPITLDVEGDATTEPTVTVTATATASTTATETATTTATATSTTTATATATTTATATSSTTATATTTVTATQTATETATVNPTGKPTVKPTSKPTATATSGPVDVYSTPGLHFVNGRHWWTKCEPYSSTTRCWTDIWGTQTVYKDGKFTSTNGWTFNNLTYLPSPRSLWDGNPLGNTGTWTAADGRQWRTECDTAETGRNGCRSHTMSKVVVAKKTPSGWTYRLTNKWVFNNIVRFS